MLILAILISAVLSYLLGSFNSSILVVRLLKHQDIREFGSHNAGLTNTLRCFGKGCAALTLVGDLAKGIVAVLLSKGICELLGTGADGTERCAFHRLYCRYFRDSGTRVPDLLPLQRRKRCAGGRVGLSGH